jgi:deoxyribodipyrimidine photo-lyase
VTSSVAVAWFRRDLRIHDHPALQRAVGEFGRVAPLFVVDTRLVGGRSGAGRAGPASPNRIWFMRQSVAELSRQLAGRGAEMSILRGNPVELVPRFAAEIGARAVVVSRDYSPYGRRRDDRVARACAPLGIDFISETGVLVHEPEAVRRSDGGSFSVFTPYHRAWEAIERRPVIGEPGRVPGVVPPNGVGRSIEAMLAGISPTADPAAIPAPGEASARDRLEAWVRSEPFAAHAVGRDRLDNNGSSRLSQDLRWGLLSPVEVLAKAEEAEGADADPSRSGVARFRTAIAWRDFYGHLLQHRPELASRSLRPELEGPAWQHDERVVDAWRLGRTGVPVVDAAMRQLLATGWMPNRARMIVASYLTKQLGVDWRVGAAHFMSHLVDGDVANNSGGWQWSASTGTDAQPWFRIFNPVLQARRFDPEGAYVRRWVPELAARGDLPGAAVHEPPPGAYLTPVVDPEEGRQRAIAAYRAARGRGAASTANGTRS